MKEQRDEKMRRGRPVTKTMPEPIPDTPENVARALLFTPAQERGASGNIGNIKPETEDGASP